MAAAAAREYGRMFRLLQAALATVETRITT
jgi:hypothetical protein